MQQLARPRDDRTICWALGLALLLHALAFVALSRLPPETMALPAAEGSVDVEIVAQMPEMPKPPPQTAEATKKAGEPSRSEPEARAVSDGQATTPVAGQPAARQPDTANASARQTPTEQPGSSAAGMIRAAKLYSKDVLAAPRSRQARKGLAQLDPQERVVQLCNLEAMEQVQRWKADFEPDFVVAYALGRVKISGGTLTASGAAFRSKRKWWRIAYSCTVTADRDAVVDFAFRVGDAIPSTRWQDLGLSVADADD
ncbi:DUF930 domain-containing protein [Ensifer sp.]|uniref:DUF930 domain-containing protein n=1 Tax=Ensifer sp. TaxID=1872086 RepID=UPI00289B5CFC|nr:DUF930 domain-containing protein [Ensifer sp.]